MKNTNDSQNTFKTDSAFGTLQEILYQAKMQDLANLSQFFGYVKIERCEQIIERFLSAKTLREWLKMGHYDMVHSSISFLAKCEVFVRPAILRAEISLAMAQNERENLLDKGYIRIKTDFKRHGQSIWALMGSQSCLYLPVCADKDWIYLSDDELLARTQNRLVAHFVKCSGRIRGTWASNIVGYEMVLCGRKIDFDTSGEIIADSANPSANQSTNLKDSAPQISLKVGKTDITNLFRFREINGGGQ